MSIRVVCPKCEKGINAPGKYAGKTAKCPGCGCRIKFPGAAAPSTPPPPPRKPASDPSQGTLPPPADIFEQMVDAPPGSTELPETKDCPFCGEAVKFVAKKCKHCGEFLDEDAAEYHRESTMITAERPNLDSSNTPKHNPGIAALLSFVLPGAGQMYRGQVGNGIAWFIIVLAGYGAFIFPGIILHLCCVFGAASKKNT